MGILGPNQSILFSILEWFFEKIEDAYYHLRKIPPMTSYALMLRRIDQQIELTNLLKEKGFTFKEEFHG